MTIATAMVVAVIVVRRAVTSGLLCDELLFLHAIDLGLWESLMAPGSSHPPLVRMIVGGIADSDSPDWLLRVPSLLCSIAVVFVWQRVLLRFVPDRILRNLTLPVMALNPIWLQQAYQSLPYAALTFFASLHCLAWLRLIERPDWKRTVAWVATAVVLPWTHFFGINVLIAGQFVWLVLWLKRQLSLRRAVYMNLAVALFTVPVIPLASFYLVHDRPYPVYEVTDYPSYFVEASSLFFSMVTFAGIETLQPLFVLVYFACGAYVWRQHIAGGIRPEVSRGEDAHGAVYGIVAISFFMAGFVACQVYSLLGQTAMWPRYMLAGAWVHFPLIILLLISWQRRMLALVTATVCAVAAMTSSVELMKPVATGSDYAQIAGHIDISCQPNDAFLAQAIDLWEGDNHFDRLWFDRYADKELPVVSGPRVSRADLRDTRITLTRIDPHIKRIWVYSHLFDEDWLLADKIKGWHLVDIRTFRNPFPLALFERSSDESPDSRFVLQRSH